MRLNQLLNKPIAMLSEAITDFVGAAIENNDSAAPQAARPYNTQNGDGVQVIRLHGVVTPRGGGGWFDFGVSCTAVVRQLREALADDRVTRIVLDIDSPGGDVVGVVELAEEIYKARGEKRITAVANGTMASAAYWIGSAADEVVVTPSGMAGSIGVVAVHMDYSEQLAQYGIKPSLIYAGAHKVEGNPYEPLGDEARAEIKRDVDRYYQMFVADVAKHRGVNRSMVQNDFGQGRVMGAKAAVQMGMADRVGTLDDVIYSTGRGRRRGKSAEMCTRQRRLRLAESS